ncbi:integrase catalytic domain-containing protein [Trichonephila clavipes]|nr:integrase catalytic domain-containing protein [Trichonephila clavipes]
MSNCDSNLCYFLCEERVEWSFTPPRTPNHGGLREAGVKAVKYHLRSPLSCDPDDFDTWTSGPFLVGRPITAIAKPSLTEASDNRLKITREASGETKAAAEFPTTLKTVIERGNYPPELVFKIDETGILGKRMPNRTFL